MVWNPADPLIGKARTNDIAEEMAVGDDFEGESVRERKVGVSEEVVVEIFKRNVGPYRGSFFLRTSIRSRVDSRIILRHNINIDKNSSDRDILAAVFLQAAALAEQDCELRGAMWDCEKTGLVAQKAARDMLKEWNAQ